MERAWLRYPRRCRSLLRASRRSHTCCWRVWCPLVLSLLSYRRTVTGCTCGLGWMRSGWPSCTATASLNSAPAASTCVSCRALSPTLFPALFSLEARAKCRRAHASMLGALAPSSWHWGKEIVLIAGGFCALFCICVCLCRCVCSFLSLSLSFAVCPSLSLFPPLPPPFPFFPSPSAVVPPALRRDDGEQNASPRDGSVMHPLQPWLGRGLKQRGWEEGLKGEGGGHSHTHTHTHTHTHSHARIRTRIHNRRAAPRLEDTIVHFGEGTRCARVSNWEAAEQHAAKATCILVLGSSLKVLKSYPSLWRAVRSRTCALHIVNQQWTPMDKIAARKTHADVQSFLHSLVAAWQATASTSTAAIASWQPTQYSEESDPFWALCEDVEDVEDDDDGGGGDDGDGGDDGKRALEVSRSSSSSSSSSSSWLMAGVRALQRKHRS